MDATQITVEDLGSTRRRLDVEIPKEAVSAEMDRAYGRVQQQARIPGFRPGKVPRKILEKHYGDQVRADVLSHLIEHSYATAVSEKGLRPVGSPEIVPETVEAGQPLRYSATVDIWPDITIDEYKGFPAKRSIRTVMDEHVDQGLEQLRDSLAELAPIEDRQVAEAEDFAAFDYDATADGKAVGEGRRENRLAQIGAGQVPTEVDQCLDGMSVGETKTIEVDFGEDYPDASVAGKKVSFTITLRGIRKKVLPEANDDLAKEHGECDTLGELRGKIRDRLAASFSAETESAVRDQLIDELLQRNLFEAPASLIEHQLDGLVEDLLARFGPHADAVRRDPDRLGEIRDKFRVQAERQVRAVLALDSLVRQQSIEIDDDEVQAKVDEMAGHAGENAQRMKSSFAEPAAREDLRARIAREHALSKIVEAANIEEVEAADISEPDVADSSENS
jgi:trigger factor